MFEGMLGTRGDVVEDVFEHVENLGDVSGDAFPEGGCCGGCF